MQYNTLYTDSTISNVSVENGSTCSSGTYRGYLLNATIRNASFLIITQAVAGSVARYLTLESTSLNVTFSSNYTLERFYFKGGTIQWTMNGNSQNGDIISFSSTFTGTINNSQISNRTTSGTPTFVFLNDTVVGNESSTMITSLDLDDPSIFAANIFTISSNYQLSGVFYLSGTGAKNIQQIVNLPLFKEVRFWSASSALVATFTKVVPALWYGNFIVGAADFILESPGGIASDLLVMNKLSGVTNTIIQTVKLV